MPASIRFRAEVLSQGKNAYVEVPACVGEAFASYAHRKRIAVAGQVRGVAFHATLVPARGGGHRLYLNKGTRVPAGIDVGERVQLELRPMREAGTDAPPDLRSGLAREKGAKVAYAKLPASQRRELIRYVEDARTQETRRRRIEKVARSTVGRLPKTKSALKTKPLWTCPKCEHVFVNTNQWHSCRRYELEDVLGDKPPAVRRSFEKFRRMVRAKGPATMQVYRDRIAFLVRVRFAGAKPKKKWLDVGFWLPRRIEHPRFTRIETITPEAHVHNVRITHADELDDQVAEWLSESYAVGCQEHLA